MEKKQTAVEWLDEQLQEAVISQDQVLRNMVIQISYEDYMSLKSKAKEMEKEQMQIDENTSDGYHTFKELYDIRMAYNAALFNDWYKQNKYDVHKSLRHNDGELCFGGDWFIVCASTPLGQISNHYPISEWEYFQVDSTDTAKYKFDGHTTKDVIASLLNL